MGKPRGSGIEGGRLPWVGRRESGGGKTETTVFEHQLKKIGEREAQIEGPLTGAINRWCKSKA